MARRVIYMKKRDLLIIAVALVAAGVLYALMSLSSGAKAGEAAGDVIVFVADKEYARGRIGEEKTIRVEQPDGKVNEIVIDSQGVYMAYSTCHNQNCVRQGKLTKSNTAGLALKNWIICLPNKVSVELRVDE